MVNSFVSETLLIANTSGTDLHCTSTFTTKWRVCFDNSIFMRHLYVFKSNSKNLFIYNICILCRTFSK